MGYDFIPDLQGVHQQSLERPGGANAPMHPPVSAPDSGAYLMATHGTTVQHEGVKLIWKIKNSYQRSKLLIM